MWSQQVRESRDSSIKYKRDHSKDFPEFYAAKMDQGRTENCVVAKLTLQPTSSNDRNIAG